MNPSRHADHRVPSFRRSLRSHVSSRILTVAAMLLLLTMAGTVGLKVVVRDATWFDCFYMAIITLTTVGFAETVELGQAGRLFIVGYLIVGIGVFTYCASQIGGWIVNVQMGRLLERRRMERELSKMKHHYIICGLGRMGEIIALQLCQRGLPFVVVDIDENVVEATCTRNGWLYVLGDATDDIVLQKAGIERASALATVLPTDADNVYVTLSARMNSEKIQIIARSSTEKAVQKLERAGATRVVSPFTTGAMKMARFMLNPAIEDFLEVADNHGNELELADVQIDESSPYVGQRLMETDLRERGVMIVGIRRANGERLMPPPGTASIEAGDSLFAFGSNQAISRLVEKDGS